MEGTFFFLIKFIQGIKDIKKEFYIYWDSFYSNFAHCHVL